MTATSRDPAGRWRLPATVLPEGDAIDLWIADGRLSTAPVDGAELLPGRFVLPGLVDAHAHLALAPGPGDDVTLDRVVASLRLNRDAGVLLVRDVGAPQSITLMLGVDPTLPRFQVAGRWLARKDRFFPQWHDPVEPDELIQAAAAEIRAGARWVKVLADWRSPGLTYEAELLTRLATAVHAARARLAVHCQWDQVDEVVAAGADSIEHGCSIDGATIALMAERGTAWTPTLSAFARPLPDDAPAAAVEKQATRLERYRAMLPAAAAAGVTILTGTDTAGSVVDEVGLLIEYGLTPVQALRAATVDARRFLDEQSIENGAPADVVTFEEDPRQDPTALARPVAIVLGGVRVA